MQERLTQFLAQWLGKPNVGNTPENTGQCVGFVEVWIDSLGLPHVWGNAKDLLANADPAHFEIIQNTPTNIPQPGDILVWGTALGPVGHTALVERADVNNVYTVDQNWREHKYVERVQHTYYGVLGWLRPKLTQVIDYEKLYNLKREEADTNWNMATKPISALGIAIDPNDKLGTAQKAVEEVNNLKRRLVEISHERDDYQTRFGEKLVLAGRYIAILDAIRQIIAGKGWPWVKTARIKDELTKANL